MQLGLLRGLTVRGPTVMHAGWTIEVHGQLGAGEPMIRTSRGEVRVWRSLDTASRAVDRIGFKSFSVILR